MTTSVVVIVANRAEHLARLLAGLSRSHRRPDEVVVVDMGSRDDPKGSAAAAAPGLRVVWIDLADEERSARHLPLAAARNAGASAARGDRLVFLDVDCIPSADLIGAYEDAIERGGLVCGPVRYLERFWWADLDLDGCDIDDDLYTRSAPNPARPPPVAERCDGDHELFWSLAFGVNRSTWNTIGGFDETYVGYGAEDTDFGFQARARGVEMRWISTGVAFHQWHTGSVPPVEHLDSLIVNAGRFRRRWGAWPMTGWLHDLRDRGLVSWDPATTELSRTSALTTAAPRTHVVSIPSTAPYTRRALPTTVDVAPDPTTPWWPHPALETEWIAEHADGIDVVHVHFGFEHRSPSDLERWCHELRDRRIALVVTVHDLHNPHEHDNRRHDQHLEILIRCADAVLTLTQAAAAEIDRRWRRRPSVVPHPHLAPLDWSRRFPRRAQPSGAKRVGINFKSFRANTVEPYAILAGVHAGAVSAGADLVVRAHAHAERRDLERLGHAADAVHTPVHLSSRAGDARFLRELVDLDVLVLPYGFGTHSGLVELGHDVGTRIVAPDRGCYANQWDDVEVFRLETTDRVDELSVRDAVAAALSKAPPAPADPADRATERAEVAAQHLDTYQRALARCRG